VRLSKSTFMEEEVYSKVQMAETINTNK